MTLFIQIIQSVIIGLSLAAMYTLMALGLTSFLYMAHGIYFERMKELGLYSRDPAVIRKKIEGLGLTGIFSRRLV